MNNDNPNFKPAPGLELIPPLNAQPQTEELLSVKAALTRTNQREALEPCGPGAQPDMKVEVSESSFACGQSYSRPLQTDAHGLR